MGGNNFPFALLNRQCIDMDTNININSSSSPTSFCQSDLPRFHQDYFTPDSTTGEVSYQYNEISQLKGFALEFDDSE